MSKFVEVKINKRQMENIRKMLAEVPRSMPRVLTNAINRTAAPAKTQVAKEIRNEVNVKAADAKNLIILHRANYGKLSAEISTSLKRIPLYKFAARQTKKGVSYKIDKSGGRQRIKGAFTATMSTGHSGVFKRAGEDRFPIIELRGPSLGEVLRTGPIIRRVSKDAYKRLSENIDNQIERILAKRRAA